MASSLQSPGLRFAANEAIMVARKTIARLDMFTKNFTSEAANPGETLMVQLFDDGEAAEFDRENNNYGHADGTTSFAPITFNHHPKKTFNYTENDFNLVNGTNLWRDSGVACGRALARSLLRTACAHINKGEVKTSGVDTITEASGVKLGTGLPFGAFNEVVISGEVTKAVVAKNLRKAASDADIDVGDTVLMLNGEKFGQLLASLDANLYGGPEAIRSGMIEGLYGFRAVIENDFLTNAAGENLVGALVPTNAIAIASRVLKIQNPKMYEEIGTNTDEKSGLTVQFRRGADWRTGDAYATGECLFGSALLQPTKIVRLVSEATSPVGPTGETGETGETV